MTAPAIQEAAARAATPVTAPTMDFPPLEPSSPDALVDGVNVDAVARAVKACAGVSELAGGRFGEIGSYLPGRRVHGVIVQPDVVEISIRARWGVPVADLYGQITSVLADVIDRRIDIQVVDIDDPPTRTGTAS